MNTLKYLAEKGGGALVNQANDIGRTPIMVAAANGQMAAVQYLAEECEASLYGSRSTALHKAAEEGHLAVVQYLVVNCFADLDRRDIDGTLPADLRGTPKKVSSDTLIELEFVNL